MICSRFTNVTFSIRKFLKVISMFDIGIVLVLIIWVVNVSKMFIHQHVIG